jgi:RNA polymerase sigma-70 factor (ECF subfamily)
MVTDDDRSLVKETLAGNRGAFEAIVGKYYKLVYNVALKIGNPPADAEDVTQSVFLKAYESLGSFDPSFKFFSWIYRIAVNESLNLRNHQKRYEGLDEDVVSEGHTTEELVDEHQLQGMVEAGLMQLKLEERVILVLSHFQELSYSEIGYILNIPDKTVKSRLYSARQALKNKLIRKHYIK